MTVGDHKQLQASTAHYDLSKEFKMNVSLFERLMLASAIWTSAAVL